METSSRGFLEAWTLSDVQQWLAEQPALSRYAKELEVLFSKYKQKLLLLSSAAALKARNGTAGMLSWAASSLQSLPQGTTGKELLCLDDEMLAEVGVSSRLHRKQLLNRRDELVEAEKHLKSTYIPAAGAVHRSPLPSTPSWGRQTSGLQASLQLMLWLPHSQLH